ncbi:MAG: type II toxin-antitoxin system VapC family toxin [Gaiellales bacterium]
MREHPDCVVDTHTWIWAVNGEERLVARAARRLLGRSERAGVPAICQLEMANLVVSGRLTTDRPAAAWLASAIESEPFAIAPLTAEIAAVAADLGSEGFHGDPADRMIYATARVLDVPLLSGDRRIHAFDRALPKARGRRVIWN